MPETTLTLPLEALPVVTAPAADTAGASASQAAPKAESEHASPEFARLLAIELSPGDEQVAEPGKVLETEQQDLKPLPPTPLDVAAALPGGKDLPPESGTPMPLPPDPMPDAFLAASPEEIPAPLTGLVPTVAEETPAPAPGPMTRALPEQSAEPVPPTLRPGTPEPGRSAQQTPALSTTSPVQPTAADVPAPAAAEAPALAATSTPEGETSEETLLAKLAEGQTSQPAVPKASGETAPPVSTHTVAQATPELANKSSSLPPRLDLPEPMRTPQWNDNLSSRISWMANNQVQKAELRLNPPELGPLEVRVAVQQDETRIVFTANNAAVREAVEAALPRLRELMGANGLNLVHVDVSAQGQGDRDQPGFSDGPMAEHGAGVSMAPDGLEDVTGWRPAATRDGLFDDYA